MNLIQYLILKLFGKKPSGLLKLKKDDRDLDLGSIFSFFGSYTPKVESKNLKTLSVKHQRGLSNCTFEAATVGKEIDEGVILSPRYLTAKAYKLGLCRKEGYADNRASQIILQKYGCVEEKDCPNDTSLSFLEYVDIDFEKLDPLAAKHKTKTFWVIKDINDYLKAIDDGHAVCFGIDWYSGFNQSGGFKYPWIISKLIGYYIGGHAMLGKGQNYIRKLITAQNSYGEEWGDNGDLYIDFNFIDKYIKKYGAYANLDIEYDKVTAQDIIEKYELQNVRGSLEGTIYLIYNGKKMPYKNAAAFVAYNGVPYTYKDTFTIVPQEELNKIYTPSDGGLLTLESGYGRYSEIVKNLNRPINNNFKKDE